MLLRMKYKHQQSQYMKPPTLSTVSVHILASNHYDSASRTKIQEGGCLRLVQARWWLMKLIRDTLVFPQRLHVTIYPVSILKGSRFSPPSPVVFHAGPSFDFKGSGSLVDCVSPVRSIGCLHCPLAEIDDACGEWPFQRVFYLFRNKTFLVFDI